MLVFVCLSVCLYVIMYRCVSSPISHHSFVKWDPIVTTLNYMEISGYFMWFLEKYLEYRDMSKVKVTKNMKCTDWAVTFEPDVIETSGWLHFVPYWKSHLLDSHRNCGTTFFKISQIILMFDFAQCRNVCLYWRGLWMVFVYQQNCYTHYNISKSDSLIWIPFKNIFSIIWNIQSWKLNDINDQ